MIILKVHPVPQKAPHVSAGKNVVKFLEGQRPKSRHVSPWYGVHFSGNVTINSESNPPIGCYRDAAFAFPDASERMKLPARHGRHLREVVGKLQGGQDRFDLSDAMGREAARVIIFVKASEAFIPKFPDRDDR